MNFLRKGYFLLQLPHVMYFPSPQGNWTKYQYYAKGLPPGQQYPSCWGKCCLESIVWYEMCFESHPSCKSAVTDIIWHSNISVPQQQGVQVSAHWIQSKRIIKNSGRQKRSKLWETQLKRPCTKPTKPNQNTCAAFTLGSLWHHCTRTAKNGLLWTRKLSPPVSTESSPLSPSSD